MCCGHRWGVATGINLALWRAEIIHCRVILGIHIHCINIRYKYIYAAEKEIQNSFPVSSHLPFGLAKSNCISSPTSLPKGERASLPLSPSTTHCGGRTALSEYKRNHASLAMRTCTCRVGMRTVACFILQTCKKKEKISGTKN